MADSKKQRFSKSPKLKIFLRKFYRLVLGLVELINPKGIDVHSSTYMKWPKNAFFVFLGCFCPYIRQPHDNIGWATLMPFASINLTNPTTNLWNFREKILRIGDFEKRCFFESAILNFFFRKKNFFFAFFAWKQVKVYWLARMGQNFDQGTNDSTFWPRPNILKGSVLKFLSN